MAGTVVRPPGEQTTLAPTPRRRWRWWVLAAVLAVVGGGIAVVTSGDGEDADRATTALPATPPAFVETPFHAVVERVTSTKTLAPDVTVTHDWVRVEELHYRDPAHWRRVLVEDRDNPFRPDESGSWKVVGPRHTGTYDPVARTVAVASTADATDEDRRGEALDPFHPEPIDVAQRCRARGPDRIAGRATARYECPVGPIPEEGLGAGATAQTWVDLETGYALRQQLSNGSGYTVRRIEYRPSIDDDLFQITVPDGARTRWVGTGEPPEAYRVRDLEVSSSIALDAQGPSQLAVAAGSIWITDAGSPPNQADGAITGGAILRVDPRTETIVARVPMPTQVRRWPDSPDQRVASAADVVAGDDVLWVTDFAGFLYRLDPTDNRFVGAPVDLASIAPAGAYPFYPSSITYGDGSVWVARDDPTLVRRGGVEVGGVLSSVVRLDAATGAVQATISLEGAPGAIRFAQGSVWLAATAIDERNPRGPSRQLVYRIDPSTNAVVATVPLREASGDAFAFGLAVDDERVWAIVLGDVFRIDTATKAVAAKVSVTDGAGRAASSGDALWVPNPDGTTVTRIEAATGQVTARLRTGESPSAAAVGFDAVWLLNHGDKTLARVPL